MNPSHKFLTALLLALSVTSVITPAFHSAEPAKPNIVYILAVDLGYRDVKCLGGENKKKGSMEGAQIGARTADGPITRGFDLFYGFHHARMMSSVFLNDSVVENVEPVDMLPKLVKHASDHIGERAKSEKPFFLYLALNSPHTPVV